MLLYTQHLECYSVITTCVERFWGLNSTVTLFFNASALGKFSLLKEMHFARYVSKFRLDVRTSYGADN